MDGGVLSWNMASMTSTAGKVFFLLSNCLGPDITGGFISYALTHFGQDYNR